MLITVRCPGCYTAFPVESDKLPERGVNARCSSCREIFRVEKPHDPAAQPPPVTQSEARRVPPPVPSPAPSAPEPPSPPQPAVAGTAFTLGKRDPTDKARRLARVLVSDMIMYNAERHRSALEHRTLAEDFGEEIERSWQEFVEQVGQDLAEGEGRQFWREALNDILAKGEALF